MELYTSTPLFCPMIALEVPRYCIRSPGADMENCPECGVSKGLHNEIFRKYFRN
jgi:hypothetical protein